MVTDGPTPGYGTMSHPRRRRDGRPGHPSPHVIMRHSRPTEDAMTTRREFLATTTGALAGIAFVGCDLLAASPARAQVARRQVMVSGKRTKVVDVHAHCAVPEALALMSMKLGGPALRPELNVATE